jgi:phosphomannomutase
MHIENIDEILKEAKRGIANHLKSSLESGRIDQQLYDHAMEHTFKALSRWLTLSHPPLKDALPSLKQGIVKSIEQGKWEDIVNAFRQNVRFGTGGIRGMMAFDRESIRKLQQEGLHTDILKGTNTLNDIVILLTSAGVAKFGKAQPEPFSRIVVGYDSRIRGYELAALVAQLFLAYEYTVYFFDAPCPYPEVTFAIPHEDIKADVGVLISASHNDYRYNGFKLSCSNGSQFDPDQREKMYRDFIDFDDFESIRLRSFDDAKPGQLKFLGGSEPEDFDYHGQELIDMHKEHRDHIKRFMMTEDVRGQQLKMPLNIAFCPFHGAGIKAVPRLLEDVGFLKENIRPVDGSKSGLGLNTLNGMFPAFCSDPGREQQPDPGDPRAAETAVRAFKEDYPGEFENLDVLIGTDPDVDRCSIVVRVPPEQRHVYDNKDYHLLPADDVWTLVLWYRLHREIEAHGHIPDVDREFVVLSHTTSDSITLLARKFGLGVVRTWVGFAALAAATRDVWQGKAEQILHLVDGRDGNYVELCHPFVCDCQGMDGGKRSINAGAMEQSNGFSILGGPPPDNRSLGEGGHVRDKDGTLAALLAAEVAAWAKEHGTSIIGLLDRKIYLDPDLGLFATFYEPDPLDGEYPGIEGDRIKKGILLKALEFHTSVQTRGFEIAGVPVKSSVIYRTGKYDAIYPPSTDFVFPDEGVRYFLDDEKLNHVTVRPSGTGNSLRFHIQLHAEPTESNLIEVKEQTRAKGREIMDDLRRLLGAPRR